MLKGFLISGDSQHVRKKRTVDYACRRILSASFISLVRKNNGSTFNSMSTRDLKRSLRSYISHQTSSLTMTMGYNP